MRKTAFLCAAVLLAALAVNISSEDTIEAVRASGNESFASVPVTMKGDKTDIRCQAELRWRSSGYHGNCPYGRVVTGVQVLDNNIAVLSCAQVEVTCR